MELAHGAWACKQRHRARISAQSYGDTQNKKGAWASVQGLILWGKGFQADKIVHAKVLRWSVPTFLRSGHTA